MIHAEPFAKSLAALNAFVFHRALLRYQQEIVERGCFSVISPWTGERLTPTVCHVVNNGDPAHGNLGIAYRLACEPAVWLLAGSIKDGFPITEAYLPADDASLWSLGEAYAEENRPWKARLQGLEAGIDDAALPEVQQPGACILLGHPNFAHQLWNELAALHTYAQARASDGATLHIKAIYEPLAPIEQLAGDLPVSVTRVGNFEELVGYQNTMTTRLGSTQISVNLREKIGELLSASRNKTLADPLLNSLGGCSPVIWLSARLDARTPDNQQELLLSLVTKIAAVYPAAGFILDGFSYPDDFGSAIYQQEGEEEGCQRADNNPGLDGIFLSSAMIEREKEISAFILELQTSLEARLTNTIVNTSGMSLANSIYLARAADYYVCHAGTLQHKIAWIYNIDGIVHSNTTGVQQGVQNWLADQLEAGVKPSLVSAKYVKDLDSIRTTNKVERNRDYHILDVEHVVQQILGDLQHSLSRLPATTTT